VRDRSLVVLGGLQIASCGVGFTSIVVGWRGCAAFWARVVDVGDGGALRGAGCGFRLLVGAGR
jgi:hypothetical protein